MSVVQSWARSAEEVRPRVAPMADAACQPRPLSGGTVVDPEISFPDNGVVVPADDFPMDRSEQICHVCPVRRECQRRAIECGEQYGVWGGLSGPERRAPLKQVKAFRSLPVGMPVRLRHGERADLRPGDLPAVAAALLRVTDLLGDGPRRLPDFAEALESVELPRAA
ncbi:WhiB family transcriptional regulator [Kitasatospora sp. NPDC094028]